MRPMKRQEYFGDSGVTADRQKLAEYYRSRKRGVCVSVDEQLTGRPQVSNDDVARLRRANSDVVMALPVESDRGQKA